MANIAVMIGKIKDLNEFERNWVRIKKPNKTQCTKIVQCIVRVQA